MGMSEVYGARDDAESIATLPHALERGVDFLYLGLSEASVETLERASRVHPIAALR